MQAPNGMNNQGTKASGEDLFFYPGCCEVELYFSQNDSLMILLHDLIRKVMKFAFTVNIQ